MLNAALLAKLRQKVLTEPNNIQVQVVSTKYLNKYKFLEVKKSARASIMWNYILGCHYLLKKSMCQALGNGINIKFRHDIWMDELSLIDKIPRDMRSTIVKNTIVGYFINNDKSYNREKFQDCLLVILWKF